MSGAEASVPKSRNRRSPTVAAFVVGVPLAALVLTVIQRGPFDDAIKHYIKNKVECVEVVLFCCALATLGFKFMRSFLERAAFRRPILPAWDGRAVDASQAASLLAGLDKHSGRLRRTYLVGRVEAILSFLASRGSADELDDQLRSLSDNDAMMMEGSYSLTRLITWAIPILGFLGTVLGITESISGVTPDKLEKSLSTVTDGLAFAFDTTALGLALTMVTMFCSFIIERLEQGILEEVDGYVDRQLAHRFERGPREAGEFSALLRQSAQTIVRSMEELVKKQADIWAKSFAETARSRAEMESSQQQRLSAALETALARTLEAHGRRLEALESQTVGRSAELVERVGALVKLARDTSKEQQTAMEQLAERMAAKMQALGSLRNETQELLKIEQSLAQNLAVLAGTGDFQEALHSLTAAIHLLTARPARDKRPGAAA
jgi:biopolymer transport protein ExbB/TolQ